MNLVHARRARAAMALAMARAMALVTFISIAAVAPLALRAQDTARAARPERPTVATHAFAVSRGVLEIEAGGARTSVPGGAEQSVVVTAKFGVAERMQLTVTSSLTRSAAHVTGADPVFAGIKWQLDEARDGRPVVALLPGVTFANGPRRERDAALSLLAAVSQSVGPVNVDLNAALTRLNGAAGPQPYLWAASFSGPISGPHGWGAELSKSATGDGAPARWLGYWSFTTHPWLVFDFGVSAATRGASATQWFAGVTWNAGRVR